MATLAVVWALTLSLEDPQLVIEPPPVQLPTITTRPVDWSDEHLLVSITTADLLASRGGGRTNTQSATTGTGDCRVFIGDQLVSSEELYDQAFTSLDNLVQAYPGGAEAIVHHPILTPPAFVPGDRNVPWRCVAGAIYHLEAAGYPRVKFLTRPVA